ADAYLVQVWGRRPAVAGTLSEDPVDGPAVTAVVVGVVRCPRRMRVGPPHPVLGTGRDRGDLHTCPPVEHGVPDLIGYRVSIPDVGLRTSGDVELCDYVRVSDPEPAALGQVHVERDAVLVTVGVVQPHVTVRGARRGTELQGRSTCHSPAPVPHRVGRWVIA